MSEKVGEDKSLLLIPPFSGLLKESLPAAEEAVLSFWDKINLLQIIEQKKTTKGDFIFYEGPPTANGRPGIHHLISRAFKDVVLRYKTMKGFKVHRRGGWDTHGLPVELEVEKKLGLKSKKEIESYGIAEFNEKCKESVFTYIDEWQKFTTRIGYSLDQKNAYFTFKPAFMESVWNIVSEVDKKDLLYKDYKVVPWCPRCGTALSSHELAQGYQDVKDLSVYVKFPVLGKENTYILAWTTTPWTMPGHVALAVGKNIEYVKVKVGEEFYILAEARVGMLPEGYEIIEKISGKELVATKYLPPYDFLEKNLPSSEKLKLEKAFQVYAADFVNTEDGTGIVHTAVMYGQDDFELGTKMGLPKFHLVDDTGHFIKNTGFLEGRYVSDEETSVEIIKDLAHRNLLFKKEKYEHSYPFCWRCKTRLIYYARDSWYIQMSKLRDTMIKENQKIHWEPEYIKDGRFGEWLNEVKDWAISRERYWGTPLPIWISEDGGKIVVDSVETLKKYVKKSGNKYFVMRHGEAIDNAKHIWDPKGDPSNHLTANGKEEAKKAAIKLKKEKIDLIFYSPFIRTTETAKIVGETLSADMIVDDRLHEFNETEQIEVNRRMGDFIYELEEKYKDKNILIISHGNPIWNLEAIAHGKNYDNFRAQEMLSTGEIRQLDFAPLPHNKNYELDLHKPFIDEVILEKNGKEYKRIKEVMDVWFDSGAVPFGEEHYPFENKKWLDAKGYPADYICEGIDQTRGWFYTLHAVGNLMGKGLAYKNVISLGLLLDKEGKKMSKSVGNIVEPWQAIGEFGADPLRFWMFAVKEPGEAKNYDPESIQDTTRKVFTLLTNVVSFYKLYGLNVGMSDKSKNVLDKWILSRLGQLISEGEKSMDSYRIIDAARSIRDFIGDLSQWYVRRSRDRMKDGGKDAIAASETLRYVLHSLVRFMAPFTPFYTEIIWGDVKDLKDRESIHLADFPKAPKVDKKLLDQMTEVRSLVSKALELRARSNIKIRQPLSALKIKDNFLKNETSLIDLIKDELNVKEVVFDKTIEGEMFLDTHITDELRNEGIARELLRNIQEKRKELGLEPKDFVEVTIKVSSSAKSKMEAFIHLLKDQGNIKDIHFDDGPDEAVIAEVKKI